MKKFSLYWRRTTWRRTKIDRRTTETHQIADSWNLGRCELFEALGRSGPGMSNLGFSVRKSLCECSVFTLDICPDSRKTNPDARPAEFLRSPSTLPPPKLRPWIGRTCLWMPPTYLWNCLRVTNCRVLHNWPLLSSAHPTVEQLQPNYSLLNYVCCENQIIMFLGLIWVSSPTRSSW